MLRTQPNAWFHSGAALGVLGLAAWLEVAPVEWALLALAISMVWSAEAMNTAVESLADAVHPEPHALVGRAKDAAAGAVLIAAIGALAIGVLVFGPKLWS